MLQQGNHPKETGVVDQESDSGAVASFVREHAEVALSSQEVRILSFQFAATCSHFQVAVSGCPSKWLPSGCTSDCYFCPENIIISPHAALEKTTISISAMLFCEEIPVFPRAARGEIMTC